MSHPPNRPGDPQIGPVSRPQAPDQPAPANTAFASPATSKPSAPLPQDGHGPHSFGQGEQPANLHFPPPQQATAFGLGAPGGNQAAGGQGGSGPRLPQPPQGSAPTPKINKALIAVIVVVAVALTALTYWLTLHKPNDPTSDKPSPTQPQSTTSIPITNTGPTEPTSPAPANAPMPKPVGNSQLHPLGPAGNYLNPGYAKGFTTRNIPSMLAGVSKDGSVYVVTEDGIDKVAYKTATGEQVWRKNDLDCRGEQADGILLCVRTNAPVDEAVLIDVATGKETVLITGRKLRLGITLLAAQDSQLFVKFDDDNNIYIASMSGQKFNWVTQIPLVDQSPVCHYLGDHIGCNTKTTYFVLNTKDGTFATPTTKLDPSYVPKWSTDGVTLIEQFGKQQVSYDFNNAVVSRGKMPADMAPADPTFYALSDLLDNKEDMIVDASGRQVARRNVDGTLFNSGKTVTNLQDWVGTSADGSFVIGENDTAGFVYTKDGVEVDKVDGATVLVQVGGLVQSLENDEKPKLLVPKG